MSADNHRDLTIRITLGSQDTAIPFGTVRVCDDGPTFNIDGIFAATLGSGNNVYAIMDALEESANHIKYILRLAAGPEDGDNWMGTKTFNELYTAGMAKNNTMMEKLGLDSKKGND